MPSDSPHRMPRGAHLISTPSYHGLYTLACEVFGSERLAEDWLMTVQSPWNVLPSYLAQTTEGAEQVACALRTLQGPRRGIWPGEGAGLSSGLASSPELAPGPVPPPRPFC